MNSKQQIIAIHQPNYFPWLGYFHKIFYSDTFIVLDDVQFSDSDLAHRTIFRKDLLSTEKKKVTIPLHRSSSFLSIKEIKINHEKQWQQEHLNKIQHLYKKAKFFNEYFALIESLINESKKYEFLSEFNFFTIKRMAELLNIQTPLKRSSDFKFFGSKTNYLLPLIKANQGTVYFSGEGAKNYQTDETFKKENISLVYQNTAYFLQENLYPQTQGPSLMGLSILDALFNIGVVGLREILSAYR